MDNLDIADLLQRESYRSVSGITVDCAHWVGYKTVYRVMSKHRIGPWSDSVLDALEGYANEKDFEIL